MRLMNESPLPKELQFSFEPKTPCVMTIEGVEVDVIETDFGISLRNESFDISNCH